MQFTEPKPLNEIIHRNLLEVLKVILPLRTKGFDLKSNAISTKKLEANFKCELKPYFENFTGRIVYTESGAHNYTVDNYTHLSRGVEVETPLDKGAIFSNPKTKIKLLTTAGI